MRKQLKAASDGRKRPTTEKQHRGRSVTEGEAVAVEARTTMAMDLSRRRLTKKEGDATYFPSVVEKKIFIYILYIL